MSPMPCLYLDLSRQTLYGKFCTGRFGSRFSSDYRRSSQVQLVYVDRRKKVESGQRATSLYYMMNKPGLVGRILNKVQPENRALSLVSAITAKCDVSAQHIQFTLFSLVFPLSFFSITHLSGRAHTSCSYSV
jgi:hypothetical protein